MHGWIIAAVVIGCICFFFMSMTILTELARKNVRTRSADKPVAVFTVLDKPVVYMWWAQALPQPTSTVIKALFARHGITVETLYGIDIPQLVVGVDERLPLPSSDRNTSPIAFRKDI